MEKMGSSRILFFLSFFIIISSCSEDRIYEQFHSIDNMLWNEMDSVAFDLKEVSSLEGKSLIAIRFNEKYPYSNCYIRLISKDSSRQVLQNKLLNVPIFHSKSGQPLGKGFGDTYTKYDTLPFTIPSGTKELVVSQYMRQDNLEGIEAVGLKILKP
jgi:gliding motility-associated lipoprotein GldH